MIRKELIPTKSKGFYNQLPPLKKLRIPLRLRRERKRKQPSIDRIESLRYQGSTIDLGQRRDKEMTTSQRRRSMQRKKKLKREPLSKMRTLRSNGLGKVKKSRNNRR